MGFWDMFKREPPSLENPDIRSKEDLLILLKKIVADEQIAVLIADLMDRTGKEGYVQIKQGGDGKPYKIEYQDLPKFDGISMEGTKERIAKLKEMLTHTSSEFGRDSLRQQLAEVEGGLAVLWINVESREEFDAKKKIIHDAYRLVNEAINNYQANKGAGKI